MGLKSVDFYRKLKRDLQSELTEASIAGAALVILRSLLLHFSTLSWHHLVAETRDNHVNFPFRRVDKSANNRVFESRSLSLLPFL